MRGKIFKTLAQARVFSDLASKNGYECSISKFSERRSRVVVHTDLISYLRKSPGKRRRVRVTYERVRRERRTVRTYFYRVRVRKIETWESLPQTIRRIQEKFNIPNKRVTYPKKFLKWFHTPSTFWAWSRQYPPYRGLGSFVKVEVWAVISRNDNSKGEDESFIYSWSRVKGLEAGVSWEQIIDIKNGLESDVMEMIEKRADYMELHDFIGFSAYPESNWYFNTLKSKQHLAKYYPR